MGFSHFITLTDLGHKQEVKVRLQVSTIVSYSRWHDDYTQVRTVNDSLINVKESPEVIDTYLREAYCTVKERHEPAQSYPQPEHSDCGSSPTGSSSSQTEGS